MSMNTLWWCGEVEQLGNHGNAAGYRGNGICWGRLADNDLQIHTYHCDLYVEFYRSCCNKIHHHVIIICLNLMSSDLSSVAKSLQNRVGNVDTVSKLARLWDFLKSQNKKRTVVSWTVRYYISPSIENTNLWPLFRATSWNNGIFGTCSCNYAYSITMSKAKD